MERRHFNITRILLQFGYAHEIVVPIVTDALIEGNDDDSIQAAPEPPPKDTREPANVNLLTMVR